VYAFLEAELGVKKKALKLPLDDKSPLTPLYQGGNKDQVKAWSDKYEIGYETMKDVIMELQRP